MISFKEFLKQKKIYSDDEFAKLYNDDMEAIDPDLDITKSDLYKDKDAIEDEAEGADDLGDTNNIDEDGEGGGSGAVAIAPSVSAPDASTGGTTSADIAQVPYGLNNNKQPSDNSKENMLIKRLDSYL